MPRMRSTGSILALSGSDHGDHKDYTEQVGDGKHFEHIRSVLAEELAPSRLTLAAGLAVAYHEDARSDVSESWRWFPQRLVDC